MPDDPQTNPDSPAATDPATTPNAPATPATPNAAAPLTAESIAAIVASTVDATVKALRPTTEAPRPAPAAAPAAPTGHSLPTSHGVVDLFNLTPSQLRELGPQGVRKNLEQLWAQGAQLAGAPPRQKPPTK